MVVDEAEVVANDVPVVWTAAAMFGDESTPVLEVSLFEDVDDGLFDSLVAVTPTTIAVKLVVSGDAAGNLSCAANIL